MRNEDIERTFKAGEPADGKMTTVLDLDPDNMGWLYFLVTYGGENNQLVNRLNATFDRYRKERKGDDPDDIRYRILLSEQEYRSIRDLLESVKTSRYYVRIPRMVRTEIWRLESSVERKEALRNEDTEGTHKEAKPAGGRVAVALVLDPDNMGWLYFLVTYGSKDNQLVSLLDTAFDQCGTATAREPCWYRVSKGREGADPNGIRYRIPLSLRQFSLVCNLLKPAPASRYYPVRIPQEASAGIGHLDDAVEKARTELLKNFTVP